MILPTVHAACFGFSGFGNGDKSYALGYQRDRVSPTVAPEVVPIGCFVQAADEGVTLGVYVGLFEAERDSRDLNPFRQYEINPRTEDPNDYILQLIGLLDSINVLVQRPDLTVNSLDRILVKNYNAVRLV